MAAMKELWENIHYELDTCVGPHAWESCQDIADRLGCPVEWVEEIVEQRWMDRLGAKVDEVMSPHATCNS